MSKRALLGKFLGVVARELAERVLEEAERKRRSEGAAPSPATDAEIRRERRRQSISDLFDAMDSLKADRQRQADDDGGFRDMKGPDGNIPFDVLRAKYGAPAIALIRPYPPHRAPAGRTRVGGLPDLPEGISWPRSAEGTPFHFLAQIDFAELPRIGGRGGEALPRSGTLLFFLRYDDELLLDEGDSHRLVFDPSSSGRRTAPPADLAPVDNHWKRTFALDGEGGPNTLPVWAWRAVAIETMPDPIAFGVSDRGEMRVGDDYLPALTRFRAEQIERNAGVRPAPDDRMRFWPSLGLFTPSSHSVPAALKPQAETGFPYCARGIALVARAILNLRRTPVSPEFATELESWRVSAESRAPSDRVGEEEASRFIDLLDSIIEADKLVRVGEDGVTRTLYKEDVWRSVEVAVHRLMTESGGDPTLAAALPDSLYEAAYPRHAPVIEGGFQRIPHSQILGHVPSSQAPLSVRSSTLTLLQLQSDWGLDLVIGDVGEFDFHIEPDALAARAWESVKVRFLGG